MITSDDSNLDHSLVSNVGGNVDVLNTGLLPWDSNRENVKTTRYIVLHKSDPECTWYRPRAVVLRDLNMTSMHKYLHDQDAYKQYTIGDMLVRTGHHNPEWKMLFNGTSEDANSDQMDDQMDDQMNDQIDEQTKLYEAKQGAWLRNERACFVYKTLTYIPDDLEHDDTSPYISLFRSVDCIQTVSDKLPLEVKGENMNELKGVDLKLREAKLLKDARNEIKKARRSRVIDSFFRAVTAPFRWLRKQF